MVFSENQQKAIHCINGPLMVMSCAGSGKTTVILERIREIMNHGVCADEILAVTFSKAAASEMEDRFLQKYHAKVQFSTIHSFCFRVLRNHFGYGHDAILSEEEKRAFILDMRERYEKPMENLLLELKERQKGQEETPQTLTERLLDADMETFYKEVTGIFSELSEVLYLNGSLDKCCPSNPETELFVGMFEDYRDYKVKYGKIDFDDMILECHRLFREDASVVAYFQKSARYIMIDEFQDTNPLQAQIFFQLAGSDGNICVVGDDDQCIYGFRGSKPHIFQSFKKHFPKAETVVLGENYRCRPDIVEKAGRLILFNQDRVPKQIRSARTDNGSCVHLHETKIQGQQSKQMIEALRSEKEKGTPLGQIAVLYRLKKEAELLVQLLERNNFPYYTSELPADIHDGLVYGDIFAYYRLANGMWKKSDLYRIIDRPMRYIKKEKVKGIGLNRDLLVAACCAQGGPSADLSRFMIDVLFYDLKSLKGMSPKAFLDYMDKKMDYRKGIVGLARYQHKEIDSYTEEFDFLREECEGFASMEEWDQDVQKRKKERQKMMKKNRENGVYLSTFHSAKGLQWDQVYILSANEGVTPHDHMGIIENPEEERRLFYVALTRAQEQVHIMYQKSSLLVTRTPSRYLGEMGVLTS